MPRRWCGVLASQTTTQAPPLRKSLVARTRVSRVKQVMACWVRMTLLLVWIPHGASTPRARFVGCGNDIHGWRTIGLWVATCCTSAGGRESWHSRSRLRSRAFYHLPTTLLLSRLGLPLKLGDLGIRRYAEATGGGGGGAGGGGGGGGRGRQPGGY